MTQPGYFPTYSGIQTAFRAPYEPNPKGKLAIVGAPFDLATSNRSGARLGPAAIREMSLTFDADRDSQYPHNKFITENLVDAGDVKIDIASPHQSIEAQLTSLLTYNSLIILGGDHSITLDSLRAHHKAFGQPLCLIHFDAHPDTWDDSYPTHGSFVTTAVKEGLIHPIHSIQIGLRTISPNNFNLYQIGSYTFQKHMRYLQTHIDWLRQFQAPTYLTFDIDVFDPAYAPGTGTPVSGGLTPREVYPILESLKGINLVGMDVVEVCPPYDHSGITALAAATVVQHILQLY